MQTWRQKEYRHENRKNTDMKTERMQTRRQKECRHEDRKNTEIKTERKENKKKKEKKGSEGRMDLLDDSWVILDQVGWWVLNNHGGQPLYHNFLHLKYCITIVSQPLHNSHYHYLYVTTMASQLLYHNHCIIIIESQPLYSNHCIRTITVHHNFNHITDYQDVTQPVRHNHCNVTITAQQPWYYTHLKKPPRSKQYLVTNMVFSYCSLHIMHNTSHTQGGGRGGGGAPQPGFRAIGRRSAAGGLLPSKDENSLAVYYQATIGEGSQLWSLSMSCRLN